MEKANYTPLQNPYPERIFLRGGGGINNAHYGELSGHYFILKEWLPGHEDLQYIGFGHYRRILAVTKDLYKSNSNITQNTFIKLFKRIKLKNIKKFISDYDIILPRPLNMEMSTEEQYKKYHPVEDFDIAIDILKRDYPEYAETADEFLNGNSGYYCLNFVMRKDLYKDCMNWLFDILFKLESKRKSVWAGYTEYGNIRTPAYIAERIINIWLMYHIKKHNLKVRETKIKFLDTEENILKKKPKNLKYFFKRVWWYMRKEFSETLDYYRNK